MSKRHEDFMALHVCAIYCNAQESQKASKNSVVAVCTTIKACRIAAARVVAAARAVIMIFFAYTSRTVTEFSETVA